jgi:acetyl-CoA synthetase
MSLSHSIDDATRAAMYARSLDDPDGFWLEQARMLDWIKAPTKAGDWSFDEGDFHVRWFEDGVLNATANCLDRHLATRGDQTAIIWEPDDPKDAPRHFTYAEVHREVCRFANVLKALGA